MTLHWWLGLACLGAVVGVVILTFRQGLQIKPDPSNRNFSPNDPGGGVSPD